MSDQKTPRPGTHTKAALQAKARAKAMAMAAKKAAAQRRAARLPKRASPALETLLLADNSTTGVLLGPINGSVAALSKPDVEDKLVLVFVHAYREYDKP